MSERTEYMNRRMMDNFAENVVYKPLRILTLLSAPLLANCGFADYMMKSSELSTRDHEAESRIELAAVNDRFTRVVEKNTALIESGQQLRREELVVEKEKVASQSEQARLTAAAVSDQARVDLARVDFERQKYADAQVALESVKQEKADRQHALDHLRTAPLIGTDSIEPVKVPGNYPTEDGFPWRYLVGAVAAVVVGLGAIGYGIKNVWQNHLDGKPAQAQAETTG